MKRRDFIRNTALMTAVSGGVIGGLSPLRALADECVVTDLGRTVVNVMLQGGADFRYLFMPAPSHPDAAYIDHVWNARKGLYNAEYLSYEQMFDSEYLLATDDQSGFAFGIHQSAAWLQTEFTAGRVAIVANAFCSRNRRHDQSILNADAGEPGLAQLNFDRAGWGGRLVEQLDGASNAVELGNSISVFSKGTVQGARLQRVIHAQDTRDMALANVDARNPASRRNVLARALHGWYAARGQEVPADKPGNWPYHAFFDQYTALEAFGARVQQRLDACGPLPAELEDLVLGNGSFAQQCRNLYDVCLVPDVLGARVLSMSYGGWDTHDNLPQEIGANLSELFGTEGGLAIARAQIESLAYNERPPLDQMVFFFASDFGRQLRANGTIGTDHGRGTYSILMGSAVRGGLYGEMFPVHEAQQDGEGRVPLLTQGADILGLTSTERILAPLCDWMQQGAGATVFPESAGSEIETPGLLDGLLFA